MFPPWAESQAAGPFEHVETATTFDRARRRSVYGRLARVVGRGGPRDCFREIAKDWYERVYLPTVDAIHAERLDEVCPEVTDPDRFLWVYQRRRELTPEYGGQQLGKAARRATEELARERRGVRGLLRGVGGPRSVPAGG